MATDDRDLTARPIPKCRCCGVVLRDEHAMLCGPCERDSELSYNQSDNQVADCDHPGLRWEGWGE